MSEKIYTIEEIREIAAPIAMEYGVAAMYLFGSYARGEATPESDLDFRIDKGQVRNLLKFGGLLNELECSFQKKLDVLTTQMVTPEFLASIRSEEVLIYAQS